MMEQYIKGGLSANSERMAADFQRRRIAYGSGDR